VGLLKRGLQMQKISISISRPGWLPQKSSKIDEALLKTLAVFQGKSGKGYCTTSQDVLCSMLSKYYKLKISRRCLNYHLKYLENKNYIRRVRRISQDRFGRLKCLPTLYWLLPKAMNFLRGLFRFGRRIGQWFKDIPKQVIVREQIEKAKKTDVQKSEKPIPMPAWVAEILKLL